MKKEIIEIQVKGTEDGVKDINKVNDSIKNTQKSAKQASNETDSLSKSALDGAKSFKIMGVSINGASKMLKVLKISLIATGIGAIVVAVGALAAAFLSTQKGVDKLNSVLTPLKEVLESVWGIAQKLGEGLFDIVKGDVTKGFDKMADAVENVGDQMDEAWRRGKKLARLQIEIEEIGVNQNLVISRQNRALNEQLEIAEDLTKTDEDRRKAFVAARGLQEAVTKLKLREKDLQIELAKDKVKANDTDREAQKELNQLIADREDIKAQGTKQQTLLLKKQNTVKAEGENLEKEPKKEDEKQKKIDEQKAKDEANEVARLEAIDKIQKDYKAKKENEEAETELQKLELQQTKALEELERLNATEEQKATIIAYWDNQIKEQKATDADAIRIKKEKDDAKGLADEEAIQKQKMAIVGQTLGAVSELLGKNTAAGKAAAIAQATMNTYQGITQVWKSESILPEPYATAAKIASTATVLASGLSAVKSIKSQKLPAGASGGSISSASAPQLPQSPSFNIVGANVDNQLETAVGSQTQEPVKAYVVSSDVTTSQEMDRNIVESASL